MNVPLIKGQNQKDNRGNLTFFNDFDMTPIRRFYITEPIDTDSIRAWQGHKKEQKWFFVLEGSFKVILVEPDDWDQPSKDLPYKEFALHANTNEILNISAGTATGFQALEPYSKLMIFSDVTLEQSIADDYRFAKGLWYKW
ncbi:WxcM-like domain-containing protein [Pedobacter psychrodurus]|uniref:WxcM-like domain-containing protein n=1 Tax=Pedobacter psychrodurus TaxID=2530456 RepID=UPI00292D6BB9|nr:WxcM-like domain-containing protein [Pedobacter psychrodurus]